MKKQLFYILLISLGAQFIYTNSEPRPRGSYNDSCSNFSYDVNQRSLSADCDYFECPKYPPCHPPLIKRTRRSWLNVGLDQEVFNCNGYLTTNRC